MCSTNYLFFYAKEVISELESKSLNIIDLKGPRANKKEFLGVTKKVQPSLIFLNGHGSPRYVCGHNDEKIVGVDDGEEALYGKIVYALSCDSARELGSNCVKNGTRAFLGYMDKFIFWYKADSVTHPLRDETARLFLGPSNRLVISLGKGNSAGIAFQKSQAEFRKNISKLVSTKSPQADTSFLPWLLWDMNCQVCLGRKDARI